MKLLCLKTFSKLEPVDDAGRDDLLKIKNGAIVKVEVIRPRNVNHLRKYWALVNLVHSNSERYETPETLHEALKVAAGIRTQFTLPNGTVGWIPGSISFDKMSQDEFNTFYETVCDLVAKHFLPGVTSKELQEEVASIIGAQI